RRDVPCEIRATLSAAKRLLEILGIEVVQIAERRIVLTPSVVIRRRRDTGIGRNEAASAVIRTIDLAAKATDVSALLEGIHTVVAHAACQCRDPVNDVE